MRKIILYADSECPMKAACEALDGKWKIPMIYVLSVNGTLRYNELKRALGITNVMLSNTLKELEECGLVSRRQYNEIPPRVEYSLTRLAQDVVPVIRAFEAWGECLLEDEKKSRDQQAGLKSSKGSCLKS